MIKTIERVLYNTETSKTIKVIEDNIKRQSIYLAITPTKKPFIWVRNPYMQPIELPLDNGETLHVNDKIAIFPIQTKTYSIKKFWDDNIY